MPWISDSLCHITDSKAQAFGFYCKSLLDSEPHKKKLLGFGIRNPSHGAINRVSFFCYYFHLLVHLIQSMFVLRSITRYSYYLFRGCHLYCFCLFQRSVPARFSQRRPIPIENRNLSMPENLVMTSAHALCLSMQTLSVGLKNLVGYRRKSQTYVLLFLSTNN